MGNRYETDVLAALIELGPSPVKIARRCNLPLMTVQQTIVGSSELRGRYQAALDEVARAVQVFGFDMKSAADYLGRRRHELDVFIKENPALQNAVEDIRQALTDAAESNLAKAVARGEWQATQFALERTTEGVRRGYGQRARVDVRAEAEALNVDPKQLRDRLVRALLAESPDKPHGGGDGV
jgi:hypothetical protein